MRGICSACGGKDGRHNKVKSPYPWPFNLVCFAIFMCPYAPEDSKK